MTCPDCRTHKTGRCVSTVFAIVSIVGLPFYVEAAQAQLRERPLAFVELRYPAEALAARTQGVVVVQVSTDGGGRVVKAESVAGPTALATAAVANVQGWTLAAGPVIDWLVFRFEIDSGVCNDDNHSLFRLTRSNLAVITACTGPGRRAGPAQTEAVPLRTLGRTPEYPPLARSANIRGAVVLELSVDAKGAVTASRALNDLPLLGPTAVAHSRTWQAWPGGPAKGIVVYEFALENWACEQETLTVFARVAADYVRLSGCVPVAQRSESLAHEP